MNSEHGHVPTHPFFAHDLIQAIEEQRIRLALVVSPEVARLAHFGHAVLANTHWEHVAIGPQLSAWLLEGQAPVTPRLLRQGLRGFLSGSKTPLLCTDIDLLFEPDLQLDPLAHFVQLSYQRPLVVLWPGNATDTCLTYAVPEHAHYRTWSRPTGPEVRIFTVPS